MTRGLLEEGDAVVLLERISVSGQKRGMQESPGFQGEWDGQEGADEEDLLVSKRSSKENIFILL